MGIESSSPLSYECERAGPTLTRRVQRLSAFVIPAHCSAIDGLEDTTGLETARGLWGLGGAVCTLEHAGRGAEAETATGGTGAGGTGRWYGGDVLGYGERISSLAGRRAICIVRDFCLFLGDSEIGIAGGTGSGWINGGLLFDATSG